MHTTEEFLFLGMEKGWSLSRGLPCKLVLPLTSGDGGRFWWLLPWGRRLLVLKLFLLWDAVQDILVNVCDYQTASF